MRLCWYAFQGVACILSPYGAFMEKPPALPGDVYLKEIISFCHDEKSHNKER